MWPKPPDICRTAVDLVEALPKGAKVSMLSHSRGGLVAGEEVAHRRSLRLRAPIRYDSRA
jgi:phosphotransacetylase